MTSLKRHSQRDISPQYGDSEGFPCRPDPYRDSSLVGNRSSHPVCAVAPLFSRNEPQLTLGKGNCEMLEIRKPHIMKSRRMIRYVRTDENRSRPEMNIRRESSAKNSFILMVSRGTQTILSQNSVLASLRKEATSSIKRGHVSVGHRGKREADDTCVAGEQRSVERKLVERGQVVHHVNRDQKEQHKRDINKKYRNRREKKTEARNLQLLNPPPVTGRLTRQPSCQPDEFYKHMDGGLGITRSKTDKMMPQNRYYDVTEVRHFDQYGSSYYTSNSRQEEKGFTKGIRYHHGQNRSYLLHKSQDHLRSNAIGKGGTNTDTETVRYTRQEKKVDRYQYQQTEIRARKQTNVRSPLFLQKRNVSVPSINERDTAEKRLTKKGSTIQVSDHTDGSKNKRHQINMDNTVKGICLKPALKPRDVNNTMIYGGTSHATKPSNGLGRSECSRSGKNWKFPELSPKPTPVSQSPVTREVTGRRIGSTANFLKYGFKYNLNGGHQNLSLKPASAADKEVMKEATASRMRHTTDSLVCHLKHRQREGHPKLQQKPAPVVHNSINRQAVENRMGPKPEFMKLARRLASREAAAFMKHCINIRKVAGHGSSTTEPVCCYIVSQRHQHEVKHGHVLE